jgi:hypothetical protein
MQSDRDASQPTGQHDRSTREAAKTNNNIRSIRADETQAK